MAGKLPSSSAGADDQFIVREQDQYLPIANVARIMRGILPAHAKTSDEAKEKMQECVSEFISFITGEANDRCKREQRKTVTAEDLLWAMSKLGFDDYIEPLTLYLHRRRQAEGAAFKPPPPPPAAAAASGDQFGTTFADQAFPPLPLPLSLTPYAAPLPPGYGQRHPPTAATPGSGNGSTAAATATSNKHGTPSFSVQEEANGDA